jgi:hypothetical protein
MVRNPLRLHVDTIARKHGSKTYVSHLLRHSYRNGTQVRHRTLANLSHLSTKTIDLIRHVRRERRSSNGSRERIEEGQRIRPPDEVMDSNFLV